MAYCHYIVASDHDLIRVDSLLRGYATSLLSLKFSDSKGSNVFNYVLTCLTFVYIV